MISHHPRTAFRTRIATATVAALAAAATAVVGTMVTPGTTWGACTGTAIDASTLTLPAVALAVGAPAAWASGADGTGVDVAVIDTGVNAVPGLSSPGKVVDAVDLSFDSQSTALRHRDLHGHGTNMAGIIAGDSSGGAFTVGVAPKARIVNVKVGAGDGAVDTSQVIAALDWIVQNRTTGGRNIRVVSLSYNTDALSDYRTDPLSHAVENAWKAGIVVVVSGGNDGKGMRSLGNPARNPFVLAVGAAAWDPARLSFKVPNWSSTGDGIRNPDIVAPGEQIASLQVPGSYLDTAHPGARVHERLTCTSLFRGSGTSQAAAATAGAAALLISHRPTLTPDQVKALLTSTALPMNMPVEQQGSGMISVARAISAAVPNQTQSFTASNGKGLLEASRGTVHVGSGADVLAGEYHAFLSSFSANTWARLSDGAKAWTSVKFDNQGRMISGAWMGSTWSGSTWSGSTWSGSTWSGSTWSGSTWSGSTWSGSTWSGSTWSGSTWSGSTWSGTGWR